jgi:hypothetical protein
MYMYPGDLPEAFSCVTGGFEAIDARDCAIGMFMSQREAAAALQEVDMKSATVARTVPSKPVFAKA